MLVKRIDKGSIPVGLYEAGEDLVKGRAVVLKNGKLYHPSTKSEAEAVMGFCTLRIESIEGGDIADHNVIKAGKKAVVYTLVKMNMWGTTEFVGTPVAGDNLSVAYAGTDKGKLIKSGATAGVDDASPAFTADEVGAAGSYALLDFFVK